jgi:hypothetical protein
MYHRRNILLYCQREQRLCVTRFVLHNVTEDVRYRVTAAQSKARVGELLKKSRRGFFDAAVVIHADLTDAAVWVAAELRRYAVPTIFLTEDEGMKLAYASVKATVACPHDTPVAYWLANLKTLMPLRAKYASKTAFGRPLGPMVQLPGRFEVRL